MVCGAPPSGALMSVRDCDTPATSTELQGLRGYTGGFVSFTKIHIDYVVVEPRIMCVYDELCAGSTQHG